VYDLQLTRPALFCHDVVVDRLLSLPARPWEVGGWVLGYWISDRSTAVITHVTPPRSYGTPLGVKISGRRHRPLFDQAWDHSNGHVTFLGDWHTHPGGPAVPSAKDARALRQLASNDDYGTPTPLALIVDLPRWPGSSRPPHVRYWLRSNEDEKTTLIEVEAQPFESLPTVAANVPDWRW
jgi:integrative and conjugative element protein (TIGR02256 family)